jgi:hypothetical protein
MNNNSFDTDRPADPERPSVMKRSVAFNATVDPIS